MSRCLHLAAVLIIGMLVTGCTGTTKYPSMQKKYASKLSRVHPGMTVAQLKAILPVRKYGESANGKSVYVLRDTVGKYQIFSDRSTKILGVGVESKAKTRRMFFHFQNGRLTHYK
jgi:hypothetical protein